MLDGQIVAALISEIKTQLGIYGIASADLIVSRSNQPTAQNARRARYQVFITPVSNTQVGYVRRYVDSALKINHVKQKSYQISALADFDPTDATSLPAHDLVQIVNDMVQQPDSVRTLKGKGVDVQECGNVRPSFEVNEGDNWESQPSFDIVVSYNTEYTKPIPFVVDVTGQSDRV
jgi:hypothetical protein